MLDRNFNLLMISVLILWTGCYSFRGISIPPSVDTYYVETFQNQAANAPADIAQQFSEELKQKINNESRLNFDDLNPDIEFSGAISNYFVRSVAPTAGNTSALNRLEISVIVEYSSNENEEDNWRQTFSYFQDFESTQDLTSVQDELVASIFDQLTEDVFNRAFTNW